MTQSDTDDKQLQCSNKSTKQPHAHAQNSGIKNFIIIIIIIPTIAVIIVVIVIIIIIVIYTEGLGRRNLF
jgi:uncharacterized membrane protein